MKRRLLYAYITNDLSTFQSLLQSSPPSSKVRQELNKKDWRGRTLMHIAATDGKTEFLNALLNHPAVDSRIQDDESGWTALHRALYYGKIECGMLLLQNNLDLLKVKDREGYSPFDLFNSTIDGTVPSPFSPFGGTDLFTFGSNANFNLGFPNNDDRTHPEKVSLPPIQSDKFKDQRILDVQMSKLHSVVLTTELQNNIYVCGYGNHGRLGLLGVKTQFKFTAIPGIFHVSAVAVAQDHTLAISSGTLYSWGSNAYGQLGYQVNQTEDFEPPFQQTPRKVFALREKKVIGCAASRVHSVAWTETEMFTWGLNQGQLGYPIDSGKSIQSTPRKVANPGGNVLMVAAIEKATFVLTFSNDVIVCMNEASFKLNFQLNRFSRHVSFFRPRTASKPNHIIKISSGGTTLLAITSMGDVFETNFSFPHLSPSQLSKQIIPSLIVGLRKKHLTIVDAVVGQADSILLCTFSGSVWKGSRRAHGSDWKFQRVPGITRAVAVRGTTSGAYAIIRDDVRLGQVTVCPSSYIQDLLKTSVFHNLVLSGEEMKMHIVHQKALDLILDERYVETLEDITVTTSCFVEYGNLRLPVSDFILASRSTTLRSVLAKKSSSPGITLNIENGVSIVTFVDIHLPTLFILLYYLYTDHLLQPFSLPEHRIPSHLQHTKTELINLSRLLDLSALWESLVTLYTQPSSTLSTNILSTIQNPEFDPWADTSVILLDSNIRINSFVLSARSSFFNAMISDTWIASRGEKKVDQSHLCSKVFNIALRYMYGDELDTLFSNLDFAHVDQFTDFVVEVMGCANELLLDRLQEGCEKLLREYGMKRNNVCSVLTDADRLGANQLKSACLEYCTINGEMMMENGVFSELDISLIRQLEEKLNVLQRRRFPTVWTNMQLEWLQAKYPTLKSDILQEQDYAIQDLKEIIGLELHSAKRSHVHLKHVPEPQNSLSAQVSELGKDFGNLDTCSVVVNNDSSQVVLLENHRNPVASKSKEVLVQSHRNLSEECALGNRASSGYTRRVSEPTNSLQNAHETGQSAVPTTLKQTTSVWGKPQVVRVSDLRSLTETLANPDSPSKFPSSRPSPKLSQRQRKRQSLCIPSKASSSQRPSDVNHNTLSPWRINTKSQKAAADPGSVSEGNEYAKRAMGWSFGSGLPSGKIVPSAEAGNSGLSKSEPSRPSVYVSLADVIMEQQQEANRLQSTCPKPSLRDIQEQEAFEKWFQMESKKVQEELAQMQRKSKGREPKRTRGTKYKVQGL